MAHRLVLFLLAFCTILLLFPAQQAAAHCDTFKGPVVNAARRALDTGNLNYVRVWIGKKEEREIEEAFTRAMRVRMLGAEAKELADRSFFETVVRLHRQGEGAPYTGLKTEEELPAVLIAADSALESTDIGHLRATLLDRLRRTLEHKWHEVIDKQKYDVDNVTMGREYVHAYVDFVHFVEAMDALTHGRDSHESLQHGVHGD